MKILSIQKIDKWIIAFMNSGQIVFFFILALLTGLRNSFHLSMLGDKVWFYGNSADIYNWPNSFGLGFTEHYIPIIIFRIVTFFLDVNDFIIWQLCSLVSIIIALIVLHGKVIKSSKSRVYGRAWTILFFTSSGSMAIMHNFGRYDSWFFLGAVIWIFANKKLYVLLGSIIMVGSHWQFALILFSSVLIINKTYKLESKLITFKLRNLIFLIIVNLSSFQLFKYGKSELYQGVSPRNRELFNNFTQGGFVDNFIQNFIVAFPNQIYSILGTLWIGIFILYYFKPNEISNFSFCLPFFIPIVAWLTMGPDGTRDVAIFTTAIVLYLFSYINSIEEKFRRRFSEKFFFRLTLLSLLFAPSINIFHGEIIVNNNWISSLWDYLQIKYFIE